MDLGLRPVDGVRQRTRLFVVEPDSSIATRPNSPSGRK